MTLLTVGALTDPQLPATASNVCTTEARLVGVGRVAPPPNKNHGYAGDLPRAYSFFRPEFSPSAKPKYEVNHTTF